MSEIIESSHAEDVAGELGLTNSAYAEDVVGEVELTSSAYGEDIADAINDGGNYDLRIFHYNIGHFSQGTQPSPTISDQSEDGYPNNTNRNYDIQLQRWGEKVSSINADVICMCEYDEHFGTKDDELVSTADTGIFTGYGVSVGKHNVERYWVNTIASKYALSNVTDIYLDSPVYYSKPLVHIGEISIKGKTVVVAATHLNWNQQQSYYESRQNEIRELVKMFQNVPYLILCGDFNTQGPMVVDYDAGLDEYDPFINGFTEDGVTYAGGFTLANMRQRPMLTYPSTYCRGTSYIPSRYLDNIIVKGFTMKNIQRVNDGRLTDHCGIVCDLTMID